MNQENQENQEKNRERANFEMNKVEEAGAAETKNSKDRAENMEENMEKKQDALQQITASGSKEPHLEKNYYNNLKSMNEPHFLDSNISISKNIDKNQPKELKKMKNTASQSPPQKDKIFFPISFFPGYPTISPTMTSINPIHSPQYTNNKQYISDEDSIQFQNADHAATQMVPRPPPSSFYMGPSLPQLPPHPSQGPIFIPQNPPPSQLSQPPMVLLPYGYPYPYPYAPPQQPLYGPYTPPFHNFSSVISDHESSEHNKNPLLLQNQEKIEDDSKTLNKIKTDFLLSSGNKKFQNTKKTRSTFRKRGILIKRKTNPSQEDEKDKNAVETNPSKLPLSDSTTLTRLNDSPPLNRSKKFREKSTPISQHHQKNQSSIKYKSTPVRKKKPLSSDETESSEKEDVGIQKEKTSIQNEYILPIPPPIPPLSSVPNTTDLETKPSYFTGLVKRKPVQIDNKIFEPDRRTIPVYYHQDTQTKEEWVLFPSPVGIYITSGINGAKMEPIASISEDKKTIHFSSIQFDESFSSIYQKSSPNYLLLRTNEIKNLNHQTAGKDLSSEKQENQEKTKITYTQEELDLLKKIPNPPKPYSNKQVILPMSSDQVPIVSSNMTSKQDKKMDLEKDKKMDPKKDQKTDLRDDFEANQKTEENFNNKQILKSNHKENQQQNKNTTIIDSNFESSVENGITKEISISKDVDGSNLKTNQPKSSIYQQQKQTPSISIPLPNKILIPSDNGVQSLSQISQYYDKITQPSNNYIELSDTSSETDEIHSSKPNEIGSSKPPNPTISSHSQQSIPSSTKRQNKQESIVDPQSIEESNNEESNLVSIRQGLNLESIHQGLNLESIHQGLNLESIHQGLNLESIHQGLNLESNKEFKIIEKKNFSNLINTFSSNKSFHSFFIIPHPPNHDCYFDLIPRKVNEFLTLLKIRDLSESSNNNNNNNNNKKFKLELKDKASSETLIKWYPPKLLTQKRFLLRTKDGYLIKTKQKNQKNNNNNNNNNKNIKESQENEQIFIPVIWFEYRNPSTQSYIPYHFHQGSRWISKTKFIDICHSPDSNAIDEFLGSISSQSKEDFIRTLLEPLSHVIQLDDKASPYIQNGFFLPIPNHQAGSFQNPQLDPNSIVFLSIKDIFPWPLYIPGQQFDSSNIPSYLQKYLDSSSTNQNSNNNNSSIHSDPNSNNNNNNKKISVNKIKISNLVQDTENDMDNEQSFEDIQTGIDLCLLLKFYDLTNIEFFLKSSTHFIVFKEFEVGFIGSYNRNTQACVQFSPSDENLSEEEYKAELTSFIKSMSQNSFLLIRFDHVLPIGDYNFPTTHHSSKKPDNNKYECISIFYSHRSINFSYFISTSRLQIIKVFYKSIHPTQ